MKRFTAAVAAILLLLGSGNAIARGGGGGGGRSVSHSTSSGHSGSVHGGSVHRGPIHVQGYYRKNGTYVQPHTRHLPGTAPKAVTYESHVYQTHFASGFVGARDTNGKIIRSEAAKHEFERMTGYPHGRPGYVVDHIIALKRGGPDTLANMQWQTIEEAKAKDRWE
jgi:hypothetical protein